MLALVKHLDGAFARVWTLNAADMMLELEASSGIYSHINGPHGRIPVGTLKVGKIARDGAPQISENLLADPDILDKDWVARERMVAFIGFPLFLEGKLVGVMALFSRQRLPEDAMELLGQVADTIAQGIARKQAEDSQGRQTALLDKVSDAVLVFGLDDRLVACNEAACRLHGWDVNPPIGQQVLTSILADPHACSRARAFTLQEGSWRDEFSAVPRLDGPRPVDCRWFLATDEAGAPESFIVVQTDTSARRELESRLLANQRTETVGLLARGLAHELTDTLFPILVSTETLQTRAADEATRESLALLEANARRSIGLVRQIQALGAPANREDARPTPTPEVAANLAAIIRGTFPKNLQTRAEIAPDLWTLRGDAVAVQQALLNLALVASRQMPDGGVFTLEAANVYLPEGDPSLPPHAEAGCHVRFTLSHTGAPLPEELLARLATAGEAASDAPGLGHAALAAGSELERAVASALHLLRQQRAFLTLEPGATPGASVAVSVPAETPAEGVTPVSAETARPSGHGEVILVVDDEESLLAITKDALESFGYRALTARDGAEAVATYSAHRQDIRAVITDMVMPNMDGPSTIRVLRKLDPYVPIIASSGLMEPAKVRELTGESDLAFLEKPYSADLLLQTVHAAVQRAP
jgi:CheY-like chemotaxis protein/PAS domain-containing protein